MEKTEPVIKNKLGEKLDAWVETPSGEIKATIVMVHGFGTNKHETAGYFDDVSKALVEDSFRVVRFDFSGYGKSEGKQEDACYSKHASDLGEVIAYVKDNFTEPLNILSHSAGCFVTAITSPLGISKTLMSGIPNANIQIILDRFSERFASREGASLNMDNISILPRTSGEVQKIGANFWSDIKSLNPVKEIESLSNKAKLLIIHLKDDKIIGNESLDQYSAISTLKTTWLPGDHSLTKTIDRQNFITIMLKFYNE